MPTSSVILSEVQEQVQGEESSDHGAVKQLQFRPDEELLRTYLARRDEAAFAQLVSRFGPLVYGVALRLLRDHHAAEDVFQATFLVLARDAGRIRRPESVGAWLHETSVRIAKSALARRNREVRWEDDMLAVDETSLLDEISEQFERQIVDEELQRLPAVYRAPLVLHVLEGKSCEETAAALGTSVGAVRGRLQRGKRELQLRLMRRGIEASAVIAAVAAWQSVAVAAVNPPLTAAAIQGGMALARGTSIPSVCSPEAVHLAAKETAMFTAGKIVVSSAALLSTAVCGWIAHAALGGTSTPPTSVLSPPLVTPLGSVGDARRETDAVTLRLESALAFVHADESDNEGDDDKGQPQSVLKYDDGKADGKKSIAGTGEMIRFTRPDPSQKLRSLRIHCARYGNPKAPDEDAEISIVSADGSDVVHTEFVPYGTFKRGESRWTTIRFEEPVEVPETFWVILEFNAEQTKGVYVSYDTSTGGAHSKTGLPGGAMRDVSFGGDWMIQAILTKPESQSESANQ